MKASRTSAATRSKRFLILGALGLVAVVATASASGPAIQESKLTPGALGGLPGAAVAISGSTIVVGASETGATGSAFVYERDVQGTWTQRAELVGAVAGEEFGSSVAIDGDTIVVGNRSWDGGAAYVFVRTGATWALQATLTPSDGTVGDLFGIAVAVSGDSVLVGAQIDDTAAGLDTGSAYAFARDAGGAWTQEAKLEAADASPADSFGFALGLSGSTAVIGAPDDIGQTAGSAYVFARDGSGWRQVAKLTGDDVNPNLYFGASVGISGTSIVVGAPLSERLPGDPLEGLGSAHVYVKTGAGWERQAVLAAADGDTNDLFGISSAIDGDTAIVGASANQGSIDSSGSGYVFVRDATGTWTQESKLTPSDGAPGDAFGWRASLSTEVAVFAAPGADGPAGDYTGAAYVFGPPPSDDDEDGDAVADAADACPGTVIPESSIRRVGRNRYALMDGDTIFDTSRGPSSFSTADTAGCSATQIGLALQLPRRQYRSGITRTVLEAWIASH